MYILSNNIVKSISAKIYYVLSTVYYVLSITHYKDQAQLVELHEELQDVWLRIYIRGRNNVRSLDMNKHIYHLIGHK